MENIDSKQESTNDRMSPQELEVWSYQEALKHHRFYVSELIWKPATIFVTASLVMFSFSLRHDDPVFSSLGCIASFILYLFWFLHLLRMYRYVQINREFIIKKEEKLRDFGACWYTFRKSRIKETMAHQFLYKIGLMRNTYTLVWWLTAAFFLVNVVTIIIKLVR